MANNVDTEEIAKFEQLASRWWDPYGEFKPLHDINPLRLDYIEQKAGGLEGKNILDVGCGGGILTEGLAKRGAKVTGIDMGEAPLEVARLHLLETTLQVDYQKISAEDFAARQAATFDVISCMEMLEHVPDPASSIKACTGLAKADADVFFSTLNRNPKAYLLAIVGAEYVLNMLPKGTHDYKKFIKPSELNVWCEAAGLKIQDISGMSYNPFSKNYSLGRDISVNYLVHCKKL